MRDLAPRCPWCRSAIAGDARTQTTNHGEMLTRRFVCGAEQSLVSWRGLLFLLPCRKKEAVRG